MENQSHNELFPSNDTYTEAVATINCYLPQHGFHTVDGHYCDNSSCDSHQCHMAD